MKIILATLVLISFSAVGHGENKPGPNGGHIRMPGAFHTELVLGPKSAKVYLLDIGFKNPTTVNSKVSLFLPGKGKNEELSCLKKDIFFECGLPENFKREGVLIVEATRNGVAGREAQYPLPLTFEKKEAPKAIDHSHHNH